MFLPFLSLYVKKKVFLRYIARFMQLLFNFGEGQSHFGHIAKWYNKHTE